MLQQRQRRLQVLLQMRQRRSLARLLDRQCWREEAATRTLQRQRPLVQRQQVDRQLHRLQLLVRRSSVVEDRQHKQGLLQRRRLWQQVRVPMRLQLLQARQLLRRWLHMGDRQQTQRGLPRLRQWLLVQTRTRQLRSLARLQGLLWCTQEATLVLLPRRQRRRLRQLVARQQLRRRLQRLLRATPVILGIVGTTRAAVGRLARASHRWATMLLQWVLRSLQREARLWRLGERLRSRLGLMVRARRMRRRQQGWRQQRR